MNTIQRNIKRTSVEPILVIQREWMNYGKNYTIKVYKNYIEVERVFTNGWQNSCYSKRYMKREQFEEKYGKITKDINPEWVYEVALDR